MIVNGYKEKKEQVLAIYDSFVKLCELAGKPVNDSISSQAEKIRAEIFNLMILGEAKSGKSTFINAYLGREVVPMDVRQCTSAIIKIHRGDKFELIATTAAGGKSTIAGIDKIQKFLKDHAAISDKYRNIPVTTINNELLIKYRGKKIPDPVLVEFIKAEQKDNIYNIDPAEYGKIIRDYITENSANWGKIIVEMDITYPLPEEMQGITIIDSPGVGAGGNVGVIAENYITEANAIIFVKSLSGQALESSSFMNFMRNTCRDRKRDSLFLVLTGKSNLAGSEVASLKEQAVEMYKNDIIEDKIIVVDSKIQLFLNKCLSLGTEERINEFFDQLDEAGNDFAPASKCWLKSRGDVKLFEEKMEELSNFPGVQNALERFARVAQYIQLAEFLENLEQEYTRYKTIFGDALKIAQENIDDPAALEDRILQKQREIDEVFIKINEGIGAIYQKYTDNIAGEGIIMAEAEKKRAEYEAKIDAFCALPESEIDNDTFLQMKKMTLDAVDDALAFRDAIAQRIIDEFNEKLIQYTDDPSMISADAFKPNFTASDFDQINAQAEKDATETKKVTTGSSFWKSTTTKSYHMWKKHVSIVATSIRDRLNDEIIPTMINNVMSYISNCREVYIEKLTEHKKELEAEYQRLLENKESNEKRLQDVEDLKKKLEATDSELKRVVALKEELSKYAVSRR